MCQKLSPVMKTELQPYCITELPNAVVSNHFFYYLTSILTPPHPFSRTSPVHHKSVLLCSALILPWLHQNLFFLNHSFLFMFMNLYLHYFPFTLLAVPSQFLLFTPPFSLQPLNAGTPVSVKCSEPTFSPWTVSGWSHTALGLKHQGELDHSQIHTWNPKLQQVTWYHHSDLLSNVSRPKFWIFTFLN